MRGTGTGVRRGNGTGSGNGRTIGASLSTETTQSVAEGRAAGLGRGQRNSGNGLEDGRLRSISGSQLTEFQGPVQNPVGLGGSLLDADLGSFSGSGSGSGSGSDSDRETEGPRHRATALQEETERLEAVQLEREAQPEVRLPRGSRQHEPRVSTSSTILEAISASRERMENRAYVRQHLARDPNQEATRGIERAPGKPRRIQNGTAAVCRVKSGGSSLLILASNPNLR